MRTVTKRFTNPVLENDAVWCAAMLDAAQATAQAIGCSPEAIVAQAALETGWGRTTIGNNVFGIKAGPEWSGAKQLVTTREWSPQRGYYTIQDWFRDYPTLADGIQDHFRFLLENARYSNVFDPDDSMSDERYFELLQEDGYATDPDYAASLTNVLSTVKMFETHMTETA